MSDEVLAVDPSEGGATRRKILTGMGVAAAGGGLLALAGGQQAHAAVEEGTYLSFGPYRLTDTREEGGKISGGQTRTLEEFSEAEGLTFAINVTVVGTENSGYLSVYNADVDRPVPYSTINWQGSGKVVANFSLVDGGAAGLKVYCSAGSNVKTHFIIDIVGIFLTSEEPAPLKVRTWEKNARKRLGR